MHKIIKKVREANMFADLSDYHKGWIVGMLEGEGTFYMRERGNGAVIEARVEVSSVDPDVITTLQRLLGGRVYGPYERKNPREKETQKWVLHKRQEVYDLCRVVAPYMHERRRDAVQRILEALEERYG